MSNSDAPIRRPTTAVQVLAFDGDGSRRKPDTLVTEEPIELRVHGPGEEPSPFVVTMRTPGNDFELAAGFCLTEGICTSADDIQQIAYCLGGDGEQLFNVVTVRLRHAGCRRRARASLPRRTRRAGSAARPRSTRSKCAASRWVPARRLRQRARDVAAGTACEQHQRVFATDRRSPRGGALCTGRRAPRGARRRRPPQRARQADRPRAARSRACRSRTTSCSFRGGCRSNSCRRPRSRASPCCARCRRRRASRWRRPSSFGQTIVGLPARRPVQRVHASRTHRLTDDVKRGGANAGRSHQEPRRARGATSGSGGSRTASASRSRHHYGAIAHTIWDNRRSLPFAWRILRKGVCDGCALGVAGLPRLDDQRRASVHDAARSVEGQHRARDRRRRARRRRRAPPHERARTARARPARASDGPAQAVSAASRASRGTTRST